MELNACPVCHTPLPAGNHPQTVEFGIATLDCPQVTDRPLVVRAPRRRIVVERT